MLSADDRKELILGLMRSFDATTWARFVRQLHQEQGPAGRALKGMTARQLLPPGGAPAPPPAILVGVVDRWIAHSDEALRDALSQADRVAGRRLDPRISRLAERLGPADPSGWTDDPEDEYEATQALYPRPAEAPDESEVTAAFRPGELSFEPRPIEDTLEVELEIELEAAAPSAPDIWSLVPGGEDEYQSQE